MPLSMVVLTAVHVCNDERTASFYYKNFIFG